MSGGGIIIQRAAVLLIAVTDPCMYAGLSDEDKETVNAIDGKDPMSRTQGDIDTLYHILGRAKSC
jgi:hypothetical protein